MDALGGARTIAVDLRGSGESNAAPGPYRLERFAADLDELVRELGIAPSVVAGHSMGAKVALRFAIDYPAQTRALVLIAPVAAGNAGFSEKGEAYLRATAGDPSAARNWLRKTISRDDDALLDRLGAAAAATPPGAVLEALESWMHTDLEEAVKRIDVPALVIAPEGDAPEMQERRVAGLLPNARYVLLDDCAHYAILEKPREIAQLIKDFVRSFDSAQDDTK
jgi:3-oxoadipate enol-lactonase